MTRPAPTIATAAVDGAGLPLRLRRATHGAHRRLERSLDLLGQPADRDRFVSILMRFWGFHAVWEPAMRRCAGLRGVMADRGRLDLLSRDLLALGVARHIIEAIPPCDAAAGLCTSLQRALGSLYVLEGSTLGGRIISRALQDAPWLPPAGLGYFEPYGPRTGRMWRELQQRLEAESGPVADPIVENGALATFALLQAWLVPSP